MEAEGGPGAHPGRIAYGDSPRQFGDLRVPDGPGPHPVVVFVHGGFWRNRWDLRLTEPQAVDITAAGFAAWNIEYRSVGDPGGGFPGTLADVAAALDHLAVLAPEFRLDLNSLAVVGHSAGGHLAFWIGQRSRVRAGDVGAGPVVSPRLVVGQAPVCDLGWAFEHGLGDGAVIDMMGGSPGQLPESHAVADPARLLPLAVDQLIVHGDRDDDVPIEATRAYARLVASTDSCAGATAPPFELTVVECEGADHYDVIDPVHQSWTLVKARISAL